MSQNLDFKVCFYYRFPIWEEGKTIMHFHSQKSVISHLKRQIKKASWVSIIIAAAWPGDFLIGLFIAGCEPK